MIKVLKKSVSMVIVFRPRLMHLQAYYMALSGSISSAIRLTKRCAEAAARMDNTLEVNWANHNTKVHIHSFFHVKVIW